MSFLYHNEQYGTFKLNFTWCPKCAFFKTCYKDGYAHYLEPACGNGPATEEEQKRALSGV